MRNQVSQTVSKRNRRVVNPKNADFQVTDNPVDSTEDVELEDEEDEDDDDEEESGKRTEPVVKETNDFGSLMTHTFRVKITGKYKNPETGKVENKHVFYENKQEPYDYQQCNSLQNAIKFAGGVLSEDDMQLLNDALVTRNDQGQETEDSIKTGKAVKKILTAWNLLQKNNAKQRVLARITSEKKPLEGSEVLTAAARTVKNIMKMMNISAEVAIENLKKIGAVPADYTVSDYENTKLRNA